MNSDTTEMKAVAVISVPELDSSDITVVNVSVVLLTACGQKLLFFLIIHNSWIPPAVIVVNVSAVCLRPIGKYDMESFQPQYQLKP